MIVSSVIFDLDGTLIDCVEDISTIINTMRVDRGLTPLDSSLYRKEISYGAVNLLNVAFKKKVINSALIQDFRSRYSKKHIKKTSIYPGVIETLSKLKSMGIKRAICTNKPDFLCDNALIDTGLAKYFDVVVANNGILNSKPHPEMLDLVLRKLGGKYGTVIMVGDSTVDQKISAKVGIPFVFFSAGYNDGVLEEQAYSCIEHIQDLLTLPFLQNPIINKIKETQ
ncbi:MAG: HAD family hydrolase [Pseudomonadota bacterium]